MNLGNKILYLDDEKELLELAATFFEDEHLNLDICDSIEEALHRVTNVHYSLIITDEKLPQGSGRDFIKKVKQQGFTGKTILVSGHIQNPNDVKDIGYDLILTKPIPFPDLIRAVKNLID
jgi:DNA-binding response OmpR family regulator